MLESVDNSVLAIAGGIGVLLMLFGFWLARILHRQQVHSDERQVAKLRHKRFAKYEEAKKDYEKFRKRIESGNTVLIDLIHDLGDEFVGRDSAQQHIAFDEAFEAVAAIRQANSRARIVVVLHTLGGYARPAHMIAQALKQHLKRVKPHNPRKTPKVIAYVPYVAMSGGTMIALSADKVVMNKTASLGPIDTIYGSFPSETYQDLLEQKGALATQDLLVMLAHEAKKYDKYARQVSRDIVNDAHKKDGKDDHSLADYLSSGELSHSQTISVGEAKKRGVNTGTDIPDVIYGLVDARIRMINTRLEFEERRMNEGDKVEDESAETPEKAIERAIQQSLKGAIKI